MLQVCFLWVLLIYTICSCHSYYHVCVFQLNRDAWVNERVCVCVCVRRCMQKSVYWGGLGLLSLISVLVCMLCFPPCMAWVCVLESQSVLSVFCVLCCAVDLGVEPALCPCFWCVSAVFVYCMQCISLSGLDRFEQSGTGLPKVFIAPL